VRVYGWAWAEPIARAHGVAPHVGYSAPLGLGFVFRLLLGSFFIRGNWWGDWWGDLGIYGRAFFIFSIISEN